MAAHLLQLNIASAWAAILFVIEALLCFRIYNAASDCVKTLIQRLNDGVTSLILTDTTNLHNILASSGLPYVFHGHDSKSPVILFVALTTFTSPFLFCGHRLFISRYSNHTTASKIISRASYASAFVYITYTKRLLGINNPFTHQFLNVIHGDFLETTYSIEFSYITSKVLYIVALIMLCPPFGWLASILFICTPDVAMLLFTGLHNVRYILYYTPFTLDLMESFRMLGLVIVSSVWAPAAWIVNRLRAVFTRITKDILIVFNRFTDDFYPKISWIPNLIGRDYFEALVILIISPSVIPLYIVSNFGSRLITDAINPSTAEPLRTLMNATRMPKLWPAMVIRLDCCESFWDTVISKFTDLAASSKNIWTLVVS